jgi:hypothetical protein
MKEEDSCLLHYSIFSVKYSLFFNSVILKLKNWVESGDNVRLNGVEVMSIWFLSRLKQIFVNQFAKPSKVLKNLVNRIS